MLLPLNTVLCGGQLTYSVPEYSSANSPPGLTSSDPSCEGYKFGLNRCSEMRKSVSGVVPLAIDEECWSALDPTANPANDVTLDLGGVCMAPQSVAQLFQRQSQCFAQGDEHGIAELVLMLVEGTVHFPEASLHASEFRCLRCWFGKRVDLSERKVTKHESQLVLEPAP